MKLGELEFRRLLVAVDGSHNADLALRAAVTAARRVNASITLISVAPDVVADAARFGFGGQMVPPDQESADHYAEQVLREAVEMIPDDIPVTKLVKRGKAERRIVEEAEASNYDAVLLGARGVGRVGALLGSVSQHVMHNAPIPVFVAHAPAERTD